MRFNVGDGHQPGRKELPWLVHYAPLTAAVNGQIETERGTENIGRPLGCNCGVSPTTLTGTDAAIKRDDPNAAAVSVDDVPN
jgi:hypothetical protein